MTAKTLTPCFSEVRKANATREIKLRSKRRNLNGCNLNSMKPLTLTPSVQFRGYPRLTAPDRGKTRLNAPNRAKIFSGGSRASIRACATPTATPVHPSALARTNTAATKTAGPPHGFSALFCAVWCYLVLFGPNFYLALGSVLFVAFTLKSNLQEKIVIFLSLRRPCRSTIIHQPSTLIEHRWSLVSRFLNAQGFGGFNKVNLNTWKKTGFRQWLQSSTSTDFEASVTDYPLSVTVQKLVSVNEDRTPPVLVRKKCAHAHGLVGGTGK